VKNVRVRKGVRQGDSISPKLFPTVLESMFQNLNWDEVEIKINDEYLHHLRFADDIVLFAYCRRTTNQNGRAV